MTDLQDLLYIIKTYTRKKKTPSISLQDLEKYSGLWSMEIRKKKKNFTDFTEYNTESFVNLLERLEKSGGCTVVRENGYPESVILNSYYTEAVRKAYEDVEADHERPFPFEENLGGVFPSNMIRIVDVKTEFVEQLKGKDEDPVLLRLVFPEGLRSMVVLSDILYPNLLQMCISKFRIYLNDRKSYDFIYHKMQGIFQHKDQNIKDMFSKIMSHRDQAMTTIINPDDFTFQFWSHFASLVLKEFREKKEKLEREIAFSQAAYLIGYYNLFFKGSKRQKRDEEAALKMVDAGLRKTPYLFSFSDIMGFRDKSGYAISRKINRETLAAYLERKTSLAEDQVIPDILKFNSKDSNRDLFLNKERYLSLTLRKVQETGRELKKQYIEEWAVILGNFKKVPEMFKRDLFIKDISRRLNLVDPLLAILLRADFLKVCLDETKPPREVYLETERILTRDKDALIPLDEIFRLDRHSIYVEAKSTLPLWKSLPVIGVLGMILKNIFNKVKKGAENIKDPTELYSRVKSPTESYRYTTSKRSKKQSSEAKEVSGFKSVKAAHVKSTGGEGPGGDTKVKTSRERLKEYREAVDKLKVHYVGKDGSLAEEADSLEEVWNPLVAGTARDNLVEDVNSMVRDYIRGLKKGFSVRPPDIERIRNIAEHIGENSAFEKIKKKDAFIRYIELYIVQLLGKK